MSEYVSDYMNEFLLYIVAHATKKSCISQNLQWRNNWHKTKCFLLNLEIWLVSILLDWKQKDGIRQIKISAALVVWRWEGGTRESVSIIFIISSLLPRLLITKWWLSILSEYYNNAIFSHYYILRMINNDFMKLENILGTFIIYLSFSQ